VYLNRPFFESLRFAVSVRGLLSFRLIDFRGLSWSFLGFRILIHFVHMVWTQLSQDRFHHRGPWCHCADF
jgi:hypothetical protein